MGQESQEQKKKKLIILGLGHLFFGGREGRDFIVQIASFCGEWIRST